MDVKPRKLPRQSRSKTTYEAIVEATTQLLVEEGYDAFTTARVARRAGVSIGSLYQYFPNKTALAAAVIDRCCEGFLDAFEAALAAGRGGNLAHRVRGMVVENVASHHLTPDVHRIVNELAPRIGMAGRTQVVSRAATDMIETMLGEHSPEIAPGIDLAVAATLIETVLEALAHRLQLSDPPPAANDRIANDAAHMILRYLTDGVDRV